MKTHHFYTLTSLLLSTALSQAAVLNIAPFGTSSMVDAADYPFDTVKNPFGGNDGNLNTMYNTGNNGTGQWTVALPKATHVTSIEIVNRGDLQAGTTTTDARVTGATLDVLDASNNVLFTTTLTDTATLGETFTFDNGGLGFSGVASVRVSKGDYMNLREVRVLADSVATGASTSGQQLSGAYPTSHGNDGIFTNFSHGRNNTTDFWQVDLGSAQNLDWVSIVGRAGFADRTNTGTITLLGEDGSTVIASDTISGLTNNGAGDGSFSMTAGYNNVRYIKVDGVNYLHVAELAAIAVPEPSTTTLLGLSGLALILRRRK
ncbi:MAG: PEP-CTERM sorting domain-containing protein [Akkermansiaceae bacterium]|nr:PEP-CTERM sorting domain-containing protein [Akkermansiaceae bacterium]